MNNKLFKRKILFFFFFILFSSFLISNIYKRYSINRIVSLVEKAANYNFSPKPEIIFLSESKFKEKIAEIIKRDLKKTELEKEIFLFRVLGLIDKKIDLYKIKKSLYNKNVAGFFDETGKGNEIFIKGEKTPYYNTMNAMLLFHELWHIIQKQKYKIDIIIPKKIEYDDHTLALLSFLEGDAIIHMENLSDFTLYIDNPEITIEDAINLSSDENIQKYPRIIREQLIFPYVYGIRFIKAIKKRYGKNYNIIYKNPPRTSLEIIFPEIYPIKLIKNPMKSNNTYLNGSLGVFFINLILKEKGVLKKYNFSLFRGWKGDYYKLVKNKSRYKFYWVIFINNPKLNKIFLLFKKGFPKAKISKEKNHINFLLEGKIWK